MNIIKAKNITKVYGESEGIVNALSNVSLSVDRGEFIAITGASGSGKSTLLNLLGGLDRATKGDIVISGNHLSSMKKSELTVFRRRYIGFVFQNYSLLPVLNAYDNIALPSTLDKGSHVNREKIKHVMNHLGIWDKRKKYPEELSGGQQQRVAIGRALAMSPSLILADEPTGNLDSKNAMEVMLILKTCCKSYQQTIIMVTHNEEMAQMCDRIICLSDGKIIKGGEEC